MARGRKTTTRKATPRKATARGRQSKELHPHQVRAQMSADLKAQTADIKMLTGNAAGMNVRRPQSGLIASQRAAESMTERLLLKTSSRK